MDPILNQLPIPLGLHSIVTSLSALNGDVLTSERLGVDTYQNTLDLFVISTVDQAE